PLFSQRNTFLITSTLTLPDALPISLFRELLPLELVPVQLFRFLAQERAPVLAHTGSAGRYEGRLQQVLEPCATTREEHLRGEAADRKSTRLNSSHVNISYAVSCLKK